MPKSANQKKKLLYLQKILLAKTDDAHAMTVNELKEALAAYDIHADRKTLYDDLELLGGCGLDICTIRTNTVRTMSATATSSSPSSSSSSTRFRARSSLRAKRALSLSTSSRTS